MNIKEYRGVEGLVAAEVLVDDNETGAGHGYITDTPFEIAGLATLSAEVDNSSDTHFYDNLAAIVIQSVGNTTISCDCSALDDAVYAKLCGYKYDSNTGAIIEGKRSTKYFAIGYKYQEIDDTGTEHTYYRWFYKTMCSIPSYSHSTKNNSTDANGQSLTFTAIDTTHRFTNADSEGIKTMAVDVTLGKANTTNFFTTVTTPDSLTQATSYTLTKTVGANTTLIVQKGSLFLDSGDPIYAGDQLKITVTGGTVTVNSNAFISGDIHVVTGNTTVVSTASE